MTITSPLTELNTRELVDRALARVTSITNGELSQFSAHSPTRALVESLVFLVNEYQFQLNLVPEATLINLLNSQGYTGSLGTKSLGSVTVTLTTIPENPFIIPAPWKLKTNDGAIFVTTETLIIDGSNNGVVNVESEVAGARYNVPSGSINSVTPGSYTDPLISIINNNSPTTGGTDPQTNEEAIRDGFSQIYAGNTLVNERDYVRRTQILNPGSRAVVVPSLGADKLTVEAGAVHVFFINSDLSTPSSTQINSTRNALLPDIFIGSQIYVSPIELITINLEVIGDADGTTNAPDLIYNALKGFLDPLTWNKPEIYYKDLEYISRDLPGITFISTVASHIDGNPPEVQDIPLPNSYTLPVLGTLQVSLSTPTGIISNSYG